MTAEHHLITDDASRAGDSLLDALHRWREVDGSATEPGGPGLRVIDAHRAVVERAKGTLMLRYGIDSHQAFALLVRWSRVTRTPVTTIAQTLLRGICEGNPHTVLRQRSLVRWLEVQLSNGDPDVGWPRRRKSRPRADA